MLALWGTERGFTRDLSLSWVTASPRQERHLWDSLWDRFLCRAPGGGV